MVLPYGGNNRKTNHFREIKLLKVDVSIYDDYEEY
jgi:hypothetical protein